MVGVSYHELTATNSRQARHSPGQRKQFLLICVVGVAVCVNGFINGGILEPVIIRDDGIYPGGEFIHKVIEDRDYATTGGIWRRISKDLQSTQYELNLKDYDSIEEDEKFDNSLYSVYIDNVLEGHGRYFSGLLIDQSQEELKSKLLEKNKNIDHIKKDETDALHTFLRNEYHVGDLPSVRSAVATFPFTDGFISALLHNYKVFPALYKYAKQNHDPNSKIVISTTCNRELKLCNHYVPMIQSEKFYMEHPTTEEYLNMKPKANKFDPATMLKGVKKMFGF